MLLAWPLFALLWFLQKKERRAGVITLTFALIYGCMRLLEDSLRIDKRFGPLTGSQWTALAVAIISVALLVSWAVSGRPVATTERHGSGDAEPRAPDA
jgi:prolipoprotein diacylglyceryltransferase